MNLFEEIKQMGTELENKRLVIMKEVEEAAKIYNNETLANFKFKKQDEYHYIAEEYEKKEN